MKKLCAILLAALMLVTMLPFAAFAKVSNNDQIMTEILSGSYPHMSYTKDNDYFKSGLIAYSVFHADTWGDQIKGDTMEAKAAKTVLLGLIDKIEAELNNETFEKVLAVLKGASTVGGLVEKANDLTGKLDFVTSSGWTTAFSTLNGIIKVANLANEEYEKYMEGYAVILSCQAASSYYGGLLDYIAEHVADENIANAARELKSYITISLEEASEELMTKIGDNVGQQGALLAIDMAMNTNTVTAAIKTGYGVVTSIGDKLFNATDTCTYMSALAAVTRIEDVLPAYVTAEIAGEDTFAADFAKISMLSLREAGETMLSNLGKVTADSIIAKVFKNADKANEIALNGAKNAAKLGVYHDILLADADYSTYLVVVDDTAGKNLIVRDKDGYAIAMLKNGVGSKLLNEDGAFYSIFDGKVNKYIRVVVTFADGCYTEFSKASSSSSSGGSSSSSSSGGGNFFANFFKAIADFFKNLFSFLK